MGDSAQSSITQIQSFWNERAALGEAAGTGDLVIKQLEMEALVSAARDGITVLDVGCGTGSTLIEMARRSAINGVGIDYASANIDAANSRLRDLQHELRGQVRFLV